jgi:hypothetical protein
VKLIGSLENFQPSSLLQWFQTERADGVLAVHGGPGYRLRFEGGELVAAAHWPPGQSLERRLERHLDEGRAGELRRASEVRGVPLADLMVEALGAEETARLVGSHAEGVIFRLLEERTGRFFFDPAAGELPGSLRTRLNVSRILLECARRQDEEERLAHWIPAATSPLRLRRDPVPLDDTQSGIRGALVEGLRQPRSRQQLEALIPVESHSVRLKLAELVRSGNVEILPEATAPSGRLAASPASTSASVLHLAKSPSADDRPFLTSAEARLLEGLRDGPRSLDEASRALRRDRQELTPVAELLVDSGWIAVREPRAQPLRIGILAAAVLAGALAGLSLLWPKLSRETDAGPTPAQAMAEAPVPPAVGSREGGEEKAAAIPIAEIARVEAAAEPPAAPALRDSGPGETERPATVALSPDPPQRAETAPAAPAPAAPVAAPVEPPEEAPAKLMVNAIPYGHVRIDGEEKGATPLQLELAPGSYEIRVHRAGYGTVVRQVELTSATVFLESFTLERDEAGEENP